MSRRITDPFIIDEFLVERKCRSFVHFLSLPKSYGADNLASESVSVDRPNCSAGLDCLQSSIFVVHQSSSFDFDKKGLSLPLSFHSTNLLQAAIWRLLYGRIPNKYHIRPDRVGVDFIMKPGQVDAMPKAKPQQTWRHRA
ncbi:unnamed protein product [Protopolystoma xenopodis]|uniref:Uncharacterized protein n=1 Tax=Protopolystoma xenopodis TaxID=117903 RepID=A0A3S5AJ81_9PLAT|nr:unnamed protein product [Protopolystoma xenopodis]